MRVRNQTTVVLTKAAQEVKDNLAPIFGLKNILSAGLLLFRELSPQQREELIAKSNNEQLKNPILQKSQTIRDVLKNLAQEKKEQPGGDLELPETVIKIEPADLDKLIKLLGPEPSPSEGRSEPQKKRKRG